MQVLGYCDKTNVDTSKINILVLYDEPVDDDYVVLDSCLACSSQNLKVYLDLNDQPLANNFIYPGDKQRTFPLILNYCENCFHSQLSIAVNPSKLFRNYLYVSGTTKTLTNYFEWLSKKIRNVFPGKATILDLASNDGSFLHAARKVGFEILGVDPAANLVQESARYGVPTLCDYWPGNCSKFFHGQFDVIVAMNVLAHVPNPLDFLVAAKDALKDEGLLYIQTSQARMFFNGEFDTVYHEHISFFTAKSMRILAERAGLTLCDGQYVDVHGTSYLWTFRKTKQVNGISQDPVFVIEKNEEQSGIYCHNNFNSFTQAAKTAVAETREIIEEFRKKDYEIWGYGAAAKGNTFINFAKIDLDGIIDDNPLKQGRISPGGNVLVSAPQVITELRDKVLFLIPAWNFLTEIEARIREKRKFKEAALLTYFPTRKIRYLDES